MKREMIYDLDERNRNGAVYPLYGRKPYGE